IIPAWKRKRRRLILKLHNRLRYQLLRREVKDFDDPIEGHRGHKCTTLNLCETCCIEPSSSSPRFISSDRVTSVKSRFFVTMAIPQCNYAIRIHARELRDPLNYNDLQCQICPAIVTVRHWRGRP